MTSMEKLRDLFAGAGLPEETRQIYTQAENTRDLMKGLQVQFGKNEVELRQHEEQLMALEKALAVEQERIRKGGLSASEETMILRRIKRLEKQCSIVDNLVAIYSDNVNLHLNLIAKIQEMEAMRLRGVSEDAIDRLLEEVGENLESYKRGRLAAESGGGPTMAVSRSQEAKELDAIKQRILGSKQPNVLPAVEEPRPRRDVE